MSVRKARPAFGAPVTAGMSLRDIAAALGVSTAQISLWKRLAAIPKREFEERLARLDQRREQTGRRFGTEALLGPVPARGRVLRALALFDGMTSDERSDFLVRIGVLQ